MRQEIKAINEVDGDGNPAGGTVHGVGLAIKWQKGPLGRGAERLEPNGAFVEGVIMAALQRLQHYQGSKFACAENDKAIAGLSAALEALDSRTAKREARGVEGTHAE